MHHILNTIVKNIQDFYKFLKHKFVKKPPQFILYQDFFCCEKTANLLGFTFLKGHGFLPNKWLKLHKYLFHVGIIMLLILELISFALSARDKLFEVMIENSLIGGVTFVILTKIYVVLYWNRKNIHETIQRLERHFPQSRVDQLILKVPAQLRIAKLLEKIYYIMFFFTVTLFSLTPFLHQIFGALKSIHVDWMLILNFNIPIDLLQPFLYESTYIIEVWVVSVGIVNVISTDLIFISLLQILTIEFDTLSLKMSEIDSIENEEDAIRELKNLVDIHQELIEISSKLEDIFSPLLLINVFGSIITLCVACFIIVVRTIFLRAKILNCKINFIKYLLSLVLVDTLSYNIFYFLLF